MQNNANGSIMESILYNHDCIILNNEDHTYQSYRLNKKFSDKLDLAICSSGIFHSLINFQLLTNEDMTSDHLPVYIEFKHSK